MERRPGIEPGSREWRSRILPLKYRRVKIRRVESNHILRLFRPTLSPDQLAARRALPAGIVATKRGAKRRVVPLDAAGGDAFAPANAAPPAGIEPASPA